MAKIGAVLLLCFTFGTFNNVNTDQQPEVEFEEKMADVNNEMNRNPNERSGFRPPPMAVSPIINPKPSPMSIPQQPPIKLLECYACSDCPRVYPNTTIKLCPYSPDPQKQSRCVVYSEKYRNMKNPWYIRGCASERGTCQDIKQAHASTGDYVTVQSCSECEGDRCNSAPRTMYNLSIAIVTLFVIPILGKYTLS